MVKKSINLCGRQGAEVSDLLVDKITDQSLRLSVGGVALARVTAIEHIGDDGLVVVEARNADNEPFIFQYAPNYDLFSSTASSIDGQPVCVDQLND